MGIFSELKKLFFVTKSVGKSAAEKSFDAAKDLGGDVLDKASDLAGDAADKAGSLGGNLMDKAAETAGGLKDTILHSAEGTANMVGKSETLQKAAEATERIGEKVLSTGEDLINKSGEALESLGSKILGENHENLDKAKSFTEDIGAKVLDAKDKMVEKAGDLYEDINDKIDATLEKAKAEEAAEAAAPPPEPFHETIAKDKDKSLLDGTDDFFAKAEKFAKGDYAGVQEGRITIDETTHEVEKTVSKAGGFIDHDGDGNELVDDAIIEVKSDTDQKISEMSDMMEEAAKAAESLNPTDAITDAAKSIVDKATDMAGDASSSLQEGAKGMLSKVGGLAAGAAALGGALTDKVGDTIQHPQEVAGDLDDKAKSMASDALDHVKDAASDAMDSVKDTTEDILNSGEEE